MLVGKKTLKSGESHNTQWCGDQHCCAHSMKVLGLTLVPSRFEGPESPGLSLGTLSSRSPPKDMQLVGLSKLVILDGPYL